MFLGHEDDAIGKASEVHGVLFEDSNIRVLKVVVPPGHKTSSHWHPKNMVYVLEPGVLRFVLPDGVSKDVELTKRQFTTGQGEHIVENIGNTEVQVLQIELKTP